jgi:glycosyltransferase involved in cell wall biosynthesis
VHHTRPKVFFESSVLGQARSNVLARTGVYRCISELLIELNRSHSELLVVPFCRDAELASSVLALLRDFDLPLGIVPRQVRLAWLLRILLPDWIARLFLRRLIVGLRQRLYDLVLHHALRTCPVTPILQDTFLITRRSFNEPFYHRVVIAYDLIPILYPEWASAGMFSALDHFYASLQPEDSVICISEATRQDLLRCYTQVNPFRSVVIHLAASANFRPESDQELISTVKMKLGLSHDDVYILSVCTLEPRKNLEMVVRAFSELCTYSNLPRQPWLVLTGAAGWGNTSITDIATELGVMDRVILSGYVPDAELPALYSGSLCFLYPSLYEGFGLPVLEAMQCGTPVIVSDRSSLPEVVGDAGLIVDPDNPTLIADSMALLCSSPDLRDALSSQAIARASLFSWSIASSKLAALYSNLHESSLSRSSL